MESKQKRKKLLLITDGFPFVQSSEAAFIVPELRELIKIYDVTTISCCIEPEGIIPEFKNEFDDLVHAYCYKPPKGQYFAQILTMLRVLVSPIFISEIIKIIKTHDKLISKIFWSFLNYYWAWDFLKWIRRLNIVKYDDEFICYTFWNQYYLLAMTMQRKKMPSMKIVSRIHGYDLFQDQSPMKWQPFKQYMDEKTDRTVFISEQGKKYYEEQYSALERSQKHVICRLGVLPQSVQIEQKRSEFLLVSCANLYPLKKIDLLIQALSLIKTEEITWIHFGKGTEEAELEKLAKELLKPTNNIKYEFKGFMPNEEVMAYYKKNSPSCFITTSFTEGSPVSMQEAIACGIPIIGTDVGGISEMIDGNGVLLSSQPTAEEVACAIQKVYNATDVEYLKMRQASLNIWAENFNREKNNDLFLNILKNL